MSDDQLRRRHSLLLCLLGHPPIAEGNDDDLDIQRCEVEVEAARRGLDLSEPVPVLRVAGVTLTDWLSLTLLLVFGGLMFWSLGAWNP